MGDFLFILGGGKRKIKMRKRRMNVVTIEDGVS